jgi:hypothetical protein
MGASVMPLLMAIMIFLWQILKGPMANIASPYGKYRTSYGDNLNSYGEYPLAIWRKLFCYGEYCLGGREGMAGIIFKEQCDLVV